MPKLKTKVKEETTEEKELIGEVVTPYTHTKLNVRKEPKKDGKVITTLYDKTKITIDPTYKGTTWLKITKPVEGYVSKAYVEVR